MGAPAPGALCHRVRGLAEDIKADLSSVMVKQQRQLPPARHPPLNLHVPLGLPSAVLSYRDDRLRKRVRITGVTRWVPARPCGQGEGRRNHLVHSRWERLLGGDRAELEGDLVPPQAIAIAEVRNPPLLGRARPLRGCEPLTEAECEGDTPICLDNTCVGCEGDTDCTEPSNGKCDTDTNTCVPCDDSAQCTEDGAGVCDAGACVECSADDETVCGTNVCDVSAGTCTDTPAGETGLCQECVSDRQCSPGRVCVPMAFDGTDLGNFCLWRLDATEVGGPNGSCTNSPPYRGSTDITTISGESVSICTLRSTTCAALADFDTMDCTTPGDSDDECGVAGLDDGLCRMVDAVVNRCTIPCDSDDDCRSGGCDLGETPPYCSF
jgi:hypothetical protein